MWGGANVELDGGNRAFGEINGGRAIADERGRHLAYVRSVPHPGHLLFATGSAAHPVGQRRPLGVRLSTNSGANPRLASLPTI